MSAKPVDHKQRLFFKMLMASQIINECLDELKNTDFYRSELKTASQRFEIAIKRNCEPMINKVFSIYPDIAIDVMAGIERILKADVYNIGFLEEIMKKVDEHGDYKDLILKIERKTEDK